MFSFKAYFCNNDVYKYAANEILTAYLNTNYLSKAEDYLYELKNLRRKLLISEDMDYSYCDRQLKDEPDKTCRDVGSRRCYDDKCKSDPVWQTYNRAYKAHYARYRNKKMTVSEFEEWSRFASNIRDKALTEEIPFEQYYADIRK